MGRRTGEIVIPKAMMVMVQARGSNRIAAAAFVYLVAVDGGLQIVVTEVMRRLHLYWARIDCPPAGWSTGRRFVVPFARRLKASSSDQREDCPLCCGGEVFRRSHVLGHLRLPGWLHTRECLADRATPGRNSVDRAVKPISLPEVQRTVAKHLFVMMEDDGSLAPSDTASVRLSNVALILAWDCAMLRRCWSFEVADYPSALSDRQSRSQNRLVQPR